VREVAEMLLSYQNNLARLLEQFQWFANRL
jgi:hypothetical protein